MIDIWKRGWIEMTNATFMKYVKCMKRMPQFGIKRIVFYTGLPVKTASAQADVMVKPDGTKVPLSFERTHEKSLVF